MKESIIIHNRQMFFSVSASAMQMHQNKKLFLALSVCIFPNYVKSTLSRESNIRIIYFTVFKEEVF